MTTPIDLIAERIESSSRSEARYIYIRSLRDGRLRVARIATHEAVYACSAICFQAANEQAAVDALIEATGSEYLSGDLVEMDAEVVAFERTVRYMAHLVAESVTRAKEALESGVALFSRTWPVRSKASHTDRAQMRVRIAARAGNPVAQKLANTLYVA